MRNQYPIHCGECCFFTCEDINGFGGCSLQDYDCRGCSDRCDLDHTAMRKDCLLRGLRYLQKWRRGAKTKQPSGHVVGKLIDASIYHLRHNTK